MRWSLFAYQLKEYFRFTDGKHRLKPEALSGLTQISKMKGFETSSPFQIFAGVLLTRDVKKVVLKHFSNFTGKHLFIKKRRQHRCFPVEFEKFLRTTI